MFSVKDIVRWVAIFCTFYAFHSLNTHLASVTGILGDICKINGPDEDSGTTFP
jgi:hypothetical protein